MVIKVFSQSEGDSANEELLVPAVSYLYRDFNARNKERDHPPMLLRGDPYVVSNLISASPHKLPYCAGSLNFTEAPSFFSPVQSDLLLEVSEEAMFPGIEPQFRSSNWAMHQTELGFEFHWVANAVDLQTGNYYSPIVMSRDRTRFRMLSAFINARFGLSNPLDPERLALFDIPRKLHKTPKAERYQDLGGLALEWIESEVVKSREELITRLHAEGIPVLWIKEGALAVPEKEREKILRGFIFSAAYTGPESLRAYRERQAEDYQTKWSNLDWVFPRLLYRMLQRAGSVMRRYRGEKAHLLPVREADPDRLPDEPDLREPPSELFRPEVQRTARKLFPALFKLASYESNNRNRRDPSVVPAEGRGSIHQLYSPSTDERPAHGDNGHRNTGTAAQSQDGSDTFGPFVEELGELLREAGRLGAEVEPPRTEISQPGTPIGLIDELLRRIARVAGEVRLQLSEVLGSAEQHARRVEYLRALRSKSNPAAKKTSFTEKSPIRPTPPGEEDFDWHS